MTAKLWSNGISYGTVLGVTFASLFPSHIRHIILDRVMDANNYYSIQWTTNLAQANEAVESFFKFY